MTCSVFFNDGGRYNSNFSQRNLQFRANSKKGSIIIRTPNYSTMWKRFHAYLLSLCMFMVETQKLVTR